MWTCGALLRPVASQRSAQANAAMVRRRNPKHFIIYSDQNPEGSRAISRTQLETLRPGACACHCGWTTPPSATATALPSSSLPTDGRRRQASLATADGLSRGLLHQAAVVAVLWRLMSCEAAYGPRSAIPATERVFFHEYSHHLMMQAARSPVPRMVCRRLRRISSPRRRSTHDGAGRDRRSAANRVYGACWTDKSLPIEPGCCVGTYGDVSKLPREQRQLLYGRGWLLTHYLTSWSRRGKASSTHYLARSIGQGITTSKPRRRPRSAISRGSRQELNAYRQRSTLQYFKVPAKKINPRARRQSDR